MCDCSVSSNYSRTSIIRTADNSDSPTSNEKKLNFKQYGTYLSKALIQDSVRLSTDTERVQAEVGIGCERVVGDK